jgi:glycosyltransferase involved in cell wall biosynthesis
VNVLFALYYDFSCNSANHVDGLASELRAMGCDCIVAVPSAPTRAELLREPLYKTATFQQVLNGDVKFDDGERIDVAHFWTPREVIRKFWEELKEKDADFVTFVQMEDNEELISRSQLHDAYDEYARGTKTEHFPAHLSHPKHWREFLEEADGITLIVDSLRELVPARKTAEVIWPSTDERSFYPRPIDPSLRKELGVDAKQTVLAYHGNVHPANFREVRSLYLAVALLNREGRPTTLLRMGRDHVDLDPGYRRWAAEHSKSIGFVASRDRLAEILSQADVFVQPGLCDKFNEYRFPSKVPDFFALGRPVVLPKVNIGLAVKHGQDAYVLDEADGPAIAEAVRTIMEDAELRGKLAHGAREFFEANLGWGTAAVNLLSLYQQVIQQRTKPVFKLSFKGNGASGEPMNLIRRYSEAKFPQLSYATVRDYCDSMDHLKILCVMNDLKDVQRPWTVKGLLGELKPGGSLLEIGAGEPAVAALMESLGWSVTACDPYDGSGHGPTEYSRYCKAYPRVKIVRAVFDATVAEPMRGQLDSVYSISVLEHVHGQNLDNVFAAIDMALKPGGLSLHCADTVIQGNGTEFHIEQMARILQFQKRLGGLDDGWDTCLKEVRELCEAAMGDVETFFLGPQGHNLWRGAMPYDSFPFRRCISVQFVGRKRG